MLAGAFVVAPSDYFVTVAAFEPITFLTSVGSSLVVAYVGVRYFTGAKIRAERADIARRELKKAVAPWLQAARARVAGRGRNLQRELRVADAQDGVDALTVIRLAADLPWWRRVLVRRRCQTIFGREWCVIAEEQADLRPEGLRDADRIMARALFHHLAPGSKIVGSGPPRVGLSGGLIQRVYSSTLDGDAKQLVSELVKLSRAR